MSANGAIMPAVVGMVVVACGIGLGAVTNRRFGHPTFHGPCPDTKTRSSNRRDNGSNSSSSSSRWRLSWSIRREEGPREGPSEDAIGGGVASTFADLPAGAIVEHIASFLYPCDLVEVAPVCRDLRKASESGRLWREHCVRAFGITAVCEAAGQKAQQQQQQQQQHTPCSEGRRLVVTSSVAAAAVGDSVPCSSSGSVSSSVSIDTRRREQEHLYHSNKDGGNRQLQTQGTTEKRIRSCHQQQQWLSEHPATCSPSVWREAFFDTHRAHARHLLQNAPPLSCMVIVGGRVHDLTAFLHRHPGGAMILREHASTDATVAFERFFHSRAAREMAREFVVWDGVEAMGCTGTLRRRTVGCHCLYDR